MWHNAFAAKCLPQNASYDGFGKEPAAACGRVSFVQRRDGTRPRVNLSASWEFETLIATLRFSRESERYTSLIPPAAIGASTS